MSVTTKTVTVRAEDCTKIEIEVDEFDASRPERKIVHVYGNGYLIASSTKENASPEALRQIDVMDERCQL